MNQFPKQKTALTNAAALWRDTKHPPRQEAIRDTVEAPNRWTEQAVNHAVDRWMQRVTVEALERWLGDEPTAGASPVVGILHGEEGPLAGFRDAIAVWGLGFDYIGAVPESSPSLLPAFASAVERQQPEARIEFGSPEMVVSRANVLLSTPGNDSRASVRDACDRHDIPKERRLIRDHRYSVGIVDGHESEDEMERLAEDMLLFEGEGRGRLAILWAPDRQAPDRYLEAMARFRGIFPAHEDTPGTLQMQQAFLDARDQSHAYAEGLEFLVSRGDPEPQRAGHIRWAEYDDFGEVEAWIAECEDDPYAVIARRHLHDQLPDSWPLRAPGGIHVPPLDDEEGRETIQFLRQVTKRNSPTSTPNSP